MKKEVERLMWSLRKVLKCLKGEKRIMGDFWKCPSKIL